MGVVCCVVQISASRDKKFCIFNAKNFELVASTTCEKAWYALALALTHTTNAAFACAMQLIPPSPSLQAVMHGAGPGPQPPAFG